MMNPERRRNARLRPRDLTFVAVRPEFTKLGKLLNISSGGLCFQYMDEQDQIGHGALFKVEIFISQNGYYLPRVPCKVIYDARIKKGMVFTKGLEHRRCGLRFKDLTEEQTDKLEFYLKNHVV